MGRNHNAQTMRKSQLLGMNHSTARRRLERNIIGSHVIGTPCYKCGKPLDSTWTVEHKVPWMPAEDPIETFFDLNNIAYSHAACNTRWTNDGSFV